MKESFQLSDQPAPDDALHIELDFQARQKSRHKAETLSGETLGWFLERGRVLADGDVLMCSDGSAVVVRAANELLSEVCSDDAFLLMRAAYHLGNRHVPLQIEQGCLRYQHDHVLDAMVEGLGLQVTSCQKPFQPENGAYHSAGGHSHGHSHSHGHAHSHGHDH